MSEEAKELLKELLEQRFIEKGMIKYIKEDLENPEIREKIRKNMKRAQKFEKENNITYRRSPFEVLRILEEDDDIYDKVKKCLERLEK